ncbi:MAG: J domain-containing protein [Myxococcales bacterium]|nr:J domain-containing protein [Myxococcales bacterium]
MTISFDPRIDYYKALGVSPSATADEIKKAYRKLAKEFHPDATGGDKRKESRFKDVSAAWEVLSDAKQRAQYDQIRAGGGRDPFGGGARRSPGGAGAGVDIGDLFASMFGGAASSGGSTRRTTGRRSDMHIDPPNWPFGQEDESTSYSTGRASAPRQTKAVDGSMLRVEGNDVHSDVRIRFDKALLGCNADIPTLESRVTVKIPPGTSSGKKLRLRGKGMADARGQTGDHYVTIHIDVPAKLDEEGNRLLEQLTRHLAGAKAKGPTTKGEP